MARRSRKPPCLTRSAKTSLDANLHPQIDASLKQLKACARSLQPVLSTFADELQILHRIYYKGKNQHRPALFWRRVTEMRRYGDRVEELSLLSLVDSLRYSFFAEESQQNSKLLKGSWTHYPDPSSVSYVHGQVAASITLVQKMHERLTHAYRSFSLAMQTGAFIQLILTLAGIASRMSSLVSELTSILEQVQGAVRYILLTFQSEVKTHDDSRLADQHRAMVASVQVSVDVDEDTGVSIARQDHQPEDRPNVAIDAIHTPPYVPLPAPSLVGVVKNAIHGGDRKPKKRRKRDEIDDIFG